MTPSMFAATPLNDRDRRNQGLVKTLFLLMTLVLIVPVLLILGLLIIRGGPALSAEFLFSNPTNGMTAGGIFPALIGTIWLVAVALLASVPIGVAAALYLSEYAPDNTVTRIINLAIINLAGVPSVVHALFGLGAFVLFFQFGTSILAASLTLAVMTLPVVIVATRESLQAVPMARFFEAELLRLRGKVLLEIEDEPAAEACFQQALDIARCQEAKSLELRAATSLARLWGRQGRGREAHKLLAGVLGWFTEGFETADLQEAQRLIPSLSTRESVRL